jgi:hypothetical protein
LPLEQTDQRANRDADENPGRVALQRDAEDDAQRQPDADAFGGVHGRSSPWRLPAVLAARTTNTASRQSGKRTVHALLSRCRDAVALAPAKMD